MTSELHKAAQAVLGAIARSIKWDPMSQEYWEEDEAEILNELRTALGKPEKQLWRVQLVMRRPETGHCYIGSWLVVSEDGPRAIETTLQSLDLGGIEVLRHRAQPQEADAPIQVGSLIRSRGYEEQ